MRFVSVIIVYVYYNLVKLKFDLSFWTNSKVSKNIFIKGGGTRGFCKTRTDIRIADKPRFRILMSPFMVHDPDKKIVASFVLFRVRRFVYTV